MNRLKTETRLGTAVTPAQTITWDYNDIGNVTSRSDIGSYGYSVSGASSVRPHAISSLVGTVNGAASPSYLYDANGNLTRVSTGRTMAWTSFNKVLNIIQASGSLAYLYDAEGERVKETHNQGGVLRTTVYLNPGAGAGLFYEEETTPAGTKKKHYLSAGGTAIGVLTLNTATSAWTTQYWHKDLLGSTVVVTDGVGAVTERLSYEPFGKRRKVDGATDLLATLKGTTTRRGFTGHEMMDDVGLVNMNGRLYDPAIGRFLSADPIVQAPGNQQSYNRYAYVWNNPMAGTDPSGYQLETVVVTGYRPRPGLRSPNGNRISADAGRRDYRGGRFDAQPMLPPGIALVAIKPSSTALGPDGSTATTLSTVNGMTGFTGFNFSYDEFSTWGHVGLSGLGAFPVLGVIPDIADLLWTGVEVPFGKSSWMDVTLATGGVVGTVAPVVGDGAAAGAKITSRVLRAEKNAAKEITLSRSIHGEAAAHAADAIRAGKPNVLTIDRAGATANRNASLGGLDKVPGRHLDEYPPAMFKEGGAGASVRPISPRDNMSAGACIGNACRGLPDGTRVRINIGD